MSPGRLAIRGGRVVTDDGEREADLIFEGERIDRVVDPGVGTADEEIDARGLVVFPGVVDAHVHFNEPGREDWEGWAHGSRGAAAGGVTTVADMPLNSVPVTATRASFMAKRAAAERGSLVDFALWGGLVPGADLAALRDLGAVGVKAFLCDSGVPEFPPTTLKAIRDAAMLVAVHAEDPRLLRAHAETWAASRPPEAEVAAVSALARLGVRVHVVHVSAAAALDVSSPRVTTETCPHYLWFTDDDVERDGALLKCAPPIRGATNRDRLWDAVLGGRVALVASDHSPCTAAMKQRDLWSAWGGIAGIQTMLPALVTEGVHRRGLPLSRLASLLAAAPARLLGLARKGRLAAGMDADVALLDLDREWKLETSALQTRSGQSGWVGQSFRGAVVRTIVRGRTIFEDGAFARPGQARLARRES